MSPDRHHAVLGSYCLAKIADDGHEAVSYFKPGKLLVPNLLLLIPPVERPPQMERDRVH